MLHYILIDSITCNVTIKNVSGLLRTVLELVTAWKKRQCGLMNQHSKFCGIFDTQCKLITVIKQPSCVLSY